MTDSSGVLQVQPQLVKRKISKLHPQRKYDRTIYIHIESHTYGTNNSSLK